MRHALRARLFLIKVWGHQGPARIKRHGACGSAHPLAHRTASNRHNRRTPGRLSRRPVYLISTICASEVPARTTSSIRLPMRARATGETYESLPFAGSASSSPTMR